MSDRPVDLDPARVLRDLGWTAGGTLTPVGGGWDTSLWKLKSGAAQFALRVFRAEQAVIWRREVEAMAAARNAGLPVPRVRASGLSGDRPALLLDWAAGDPLLKAATGRPWRLWRLGAAFGEVHARLHRVDPPAAWSDDAPVWQRPAPPDRLRRTFERLELRRRLLHLDYHPRNVMVGVRRVNAVLDWANARAGDPRFDQARTVAILRLAPAGPGSSPAVALLGRRLLETAWRAGYERGGERIGDLAPFYAWVGVWMLADYTPKLGRPGVWLSERDLARINAWTRYWLDRA